jgi:hypothetical protein
VNSGSVPTTAVASHQKARAKTFLARMDRHVAVLRLEDVDAVAAFYLDAGGDRVSREHALERLHRAPELRGRRARQAIPPPPRVDVGVVELDAREVACRPTRGTRLSGNRLQKPAAVERLDAGTPEPSQSKRELLQRRTWIRELLEHQHGELREPQLAGEEEADGAGSRDDHVVDQGVLPARVFGPGLRQMRSSSIGRANALVMLLLVRSPVTRIPRPSR